MKAVLHRLRQHTDGVMCVEFNADGSLLASGSSDGKVIVWNVHDGVPVRKFNCGAGVEEVSWRGDKLELAAGLANSKVALLSLKK